MSEASPTDEITPNYFKCKIPSQIVTISERLQGGVFLGVFRDVTGRIIRGKLSFAYSGGGESFTVQGPNISEVQRVSYGKFKASQQQWQAALKGLMMGAGFSVMMFVIICLNDSDVFDESDNFLLAAGISLVAGLIGGFLFGFVPAASKVAGDLTLFSFWLDGQQAVQFAVEVERTEKIIDMLRTLGLSPESENSSGPAQPPADREFFDAGRLWRKPE